MSDVPSLARRIQVEETRFKFAITESWSFKIGGVINFLLDHYALPVSMSVHFAGPEDQIPVGWFPEDGRELARAGLYAPLFTAIGTFYGSGDGFSTFNIPDCRGIFKRMVDTTSEGSAGRDPNEATRVPTGSGDPDEVGSFQSDIFKDHFHTIPGLGSGSGAGNGSNYGGGTSLVPDVTAGTGGAETRPKNIYMNSIIKW